MNGPAPGWQPDPTGRHEYRYWDGTKWSDDVSDGGATSTDPLAGPQQSTQQIPQAQQPPTAPQPGYQAGYDPSAYDSSPGGPASPGGPGPQGYGTPSGGYGSPSGGYPPSFGGEPPVQQGGGSGPSTGLLVGLGVLVLVLIGGIAFVLLGKDDKKDDTATGNDTTTTTAGSGTTDPATTAADDGGGGSNDAVVSAIADGIESESQGVLTHDEAQCMAQAMVDTIGLDRLVELGLEADDPSSDPLSVLTSDEQDTVVQAMLNCVDASKLAELPSVGG